MRNLFIFSIIATMLSFLLEAREEVVLTIPKAGTHYLKMIIENITNFETEIPTDPHDFIETYNSYCWDEKTIVMGHCEPLILDVLPQNLLLLIRDPRDVALSAIDYIDKKGLVVWPGLPSILSSQQWDLLSKMEKLSLILNDYYDDRRISIVNLFETAVNLAEQKKYFIVKYESLSPEHNTLDELIATIQDIGRFFGKEIDSSKAEDVIKKSFRNPKSWSFNKGKAFRYVDEDKEIVELLQSTLSNYIDYFNY